MKQKHRFAPISLGLASMAALLLSCGNAASPESMADAAIKRADAAVEETENELLGKLPYIAECNAAADDSLKKISEQAWQAMAEGTKSDSQQQRKEAFAAFSKSLEEAKTAIAGHYQAAAEPVQQSLVGTTVKAATDTRVFDNKSVRAEITGFRGTGTVMLTVTLTPTAPVGKSFRMVLADEQMRMIAPFRLLTSPKRAGETFSTEVAVPTKMLAATSILLFDNQ